MNKKRKRLLKRKLEHVHAKCRNDKHWWRNSSTWNNMRTCKCCGSMDFRDSYKECVK